jgi:Protein of unknown function (DUF2971)
VADESSIQNILYKYVDASTARLILGCARLRCSSPLTFNDPLDSQGDPYWFARTRTGMLELIKADQAIRPKSHSDSYDMYLDTEVIRKFKPPAAHEIERARLNYLRRIRILCMSMADDLPMMWSHYARQHEGVAIGFDRKSLEEAFRRKFDALPVRIGEVEYADEAPKGCTTAEFLKGGSPEGVLDERVLGFMFTKKRCWSCEAEWRLVAQVTNGATGDFADMAISEAAAPVSLTRGCRTPAREWEALKAMALALNPDIAFRCAEADLTTYSVRIRAEREVLNQEGWQA